MDKISISKAQKRWHNLSSNLDIQKSLRSSYSQDKTQWNRKRKVPTSLLLSLLSVVYGSFFPYVTRSVRNTLCEESSYGMSEAAGLSVMIVLPTNKAANPCGLFITQRMRHCALKLAKALCYYCGPSMYFGIFWVTTALFRSRDV